MNRHFLELIGIPSSTGAHGPGQELAPGAFRSARLPDRLRARRLDVHAPADLPCAPFRPDPEHPRERSAARVAHVARQVAERVDQAVEGGRWPLALGGDCTVSLGVVAGLARHHERLGLAYFDGDLDLNTPQTTPSGIFDGMVLAHLLGRGAPALAGLGPRRPLLSEEDVAVFGYDPGAGSIDPPELEALERSRLMRFPVESVRNDPVAAAGAAMAGLEDRCEAILVHFDLDVTDCPAADVPHSQGLALDAALDALGVFLAAPRCAGLVVTELNPTRDADGAETERLTAGLVEALSHLREPAP